MAGVNRSMLERAVALAMEAHAGQVDKRGRPYILHPLRVMLELEPYGDVAMAAGVLHDAFEDTDLRPRGALAAGIPEEVVEAVLAVTRHAFGRETHHQLVVRAAEHPIGRLVKLADVRDNMAPDRRFPGSESLIEGRYVPALRILEAGHDGSE